MKWQEVRDVYPDQYVQVQILSSHMEGNTKYVDGIIVAHTSNVELKIEIRTIWGLRGVVQHGT